MNERYFNDLSYHELRLLAVRLGVLVQDNPSLDVLRQRILQCQTV